ncbi:alpha-L-fucosidase [Olivibacter sp. SDN3]|uniref:alpha-L-fucosidase n=1 Tax=Olivibacter sp. SDN3 TaxID=2764720 RepID=UPI001650EFE3|nr:alpha-L-fucosidase [Olivibacter sp. SDN3]QNL50619.1 alpha-L-fucosidase [Olivibacter sp. SDN3]
MKKQTYLILFLCLGMLQEAIAQFPGASSQRSSVSLKHGAHRLGKRTDAQMETWRNYGLGQFIHWGLYAIPGGHWNGKYYPGAAEWIRSWNEMPNEDYDNLYKQFDPKHFDAKAWAAQAKDMGARYVIITTKHHDGFCIWPSKYTDYTIANTPYKNDALKELVDAYDAVGIDVYLYFSIIDWNHNGYRSGVPESGDEKQSYEAFKDFTANQLKELLTTYPTTKGLWFDGTWDKAWIAEAEFTDSLEAELRAMRPGLIIGSRFRADENGRRHFDSNGDLIGDYEQGWERKLPTRIEEVHGNDWDCVMTVPENQWGYHSDWRGHVKTSTELIEMMTRAVALDGNFVLNFGPDGQGAIRPEETKLAKEIGEWMKVNHEAIYDCEYAGLEKQDWGYITKSRKTGKYYLVVFNVPISGALKIKIAPGTGIAKVYDLTDSGNTYEPEEAHRSKTDGNEYLIHLEEKPSQPKVIVLESSGEKADSEVLYEKAKT